MITLQEVFIKFYDQFNQQYKSSTIQAKAAKDIIQCRTPVLGGHIHECEECGHTIKGTEFIRRFLMHILPKGFVKIRYFGLLSNRNKKTKLALCKRITGSPTYIPKLNGLKTPEIMSIVTGRDISLCPCCGRGKMRMVRTFLPAASP